MANTKEVILEKILNRDAALMLLHRTQETVEHNGLKYEMVRKELVPKAMDEFAEEMAIGFDEWKIENDWEWSVSKKASEGKTMWYQVPGDGNYLTTAELYKLYIETLDK